MFVGTLLEDGDFAPDRRCRHDAPSAGAGSGLDSPTLGSDRKTGARGKSRRCSQTRPPYGPLPRPPRPSSDRYQTGTDVHSRRTCSGPLTTVVTVTGLVGHPVVRGRVSSQGSLEFGARTDPSHTPGANRPPGSRTGPEGQETRTCRLLTPPVQYWGPLHPVRFPNRGSESVFRRRFGRRLKFQNGGSPLW